MSTQTGRCFCVCVCVCVCAVCLCSGEGCHRVWKHEVGVLVGNNCRSGQVTWGFGCFLSADSGSEGWARVHGRYRRTDSSSGGGRHCKNGGSTSVPECTGPTAMLPATGRPLSDPTDSCRTCHQTCFPRLGLPVAARCVCRSSVVGRPRSPSHLAITLWAMSRARF